MQPVPIFRNAWLWPGLSCCRQLLKKEVSEERSSVLVWFATRVLTGGRGWERGDPFAAGPLRPAAFSSVAAGIPGWLEASRSRAFFHCAPTSILVWLAEEVRVTVETKRRLKNESSCSCYHGTCFIGRSQHEHASGLSGCSGDGLPRVQRGLGQESVKLCTQRVVTRRPPSVPGHQAEWPRGPGRLSGCAVWTGDFAPDFGSCAAWSQDCRRKG